MALAGKDQTEAKTKLRDALGSEARALASELAPRPDGRTRRRFALMQAAADQIAKSEDPGANSRSKLCGVEGVGTRGSKQTIRIAARAAAAMTLQAGEHDQLQLLLEALQELGPSSLYLERGSKISNVH